MNTRLSVQKSIAGTSAERPPAGPLATYFCAADAGVSLKDYSTRADVMMDCLLRYYEQYKPDVIWLELDAWIIAEAIGIPMKYKNMENPPYPEHNNLIQYPEDLERLPMSSDMPRSRQPVILDVASKIREQLGDSVFIAAGTGMMPYSLACALAGVQRINGWLKSDPAFAQEIFNFCKTHIMTYAQALFSNDIDLLVIEEPSVSELSMLRFRSTVLPLLTDTILALRSLTTLPISLRLPGPSMELLGDLATVPVDVLELGYEVPLGVACDRIPETIGLWGGIDPYKVMLKGSARQVRNVVQDVLALIDETGRRRFVIGSSGPLAPMTPAANLKGLLWAAREWRE